MKSAVEEHAVEKCKINWNWKERKDVTQIKYSIGYTKMQIGRTSEK